MTAAFVPSIKSANQQINKFHSYVFDNPDDSDNSDISSIFMEKTNETSSITIILIGTVTKYLLELLLEPLLARNLSTSWTASWATAQLFI